MFLIARQNRYLRKFTTAGAVAPDSAKALREVGVRDSRIFRRLIGHGVLVEAEPGRFYLDPSASTTFRQRRRQQALVLLAVIGVALAPLLVFLLVR
jgi:hypothetical protein